LKYFLKVFYTTLDKIVNARMSTGAALNWNIPPTLTLASYRIMCSSENGNVNYSAV